jgi:hypothetical protein
LGLLGCLVVIDLHHVYVLLLFRFASTGELKEKEDEDASEFYILCYLLVQYSMLFTISIHDYMLQHVSIMLGRVDVFN